MFERFTPELIETVRFAQFEAGKGKSPCIRPEHLLVGLVYAEGQTGAIMREAGITVDKIYSQLGELAIQEEPSPPLGDMPLDINSKSILEQCWQRSEQFGHAHCGSEHLLFVLVQDRADRAVNEVLLGIGVGVLSDQQLEKLFANMSKSSSVTDETEKLRRKIAAWSGRAEMARARGDNDLLQQALHEKEKYEMELADSQASSET